MDMMRRWSFLVWGWKYLYIYVQPKLNKILHLFVALEKIKIWTFSRLFKYFLPWNLEINGTALSCLPVSGIYLVWLFLFFLVLKKKIHFQALSGFNILLVNSNPKTGQRLEGHYPQYDMHHPTWPGLTKKKKLTCIMKFIFGIWGLDIFHNHKHFLGQKGSERQIREYLMP